MEGIKKMMDNLCYLMGDVIANAEMTEQPGNPVPLLDEYSEKKLDMIQEVMDYLCAMEKGKHIKKGWKSGGVAENARAREYSDRISSQLAAGEPAENVYCMVDVYYGGLERR